MKWNADMYQNKHSFVAKYGERLLTFVNRKKGQTILDLGCGTGHLTQELAAQGARVIGMDSSEAMVEKARKDHPNLEFFLGDAMELPYGDFFDTIFSNAVFHWIPDQKKLIGSVRNALKEGGKLVCEFGASRNIQAIQDAFCRQLEERGMTYQSPFLFPTALDYQALLESEGMTVRHLLEYDRPTPLSDGEAGLRNWVVQFFVEDLRRLSEHEQEALLCGMERELCDSLWDGENGHWVADYRRLQAVAVRA